MHETWCRCEFLCMLGLFGNDMNFFFFFDKVTFFNWHIYHFFLLFYFNLNLYIAFHYTSFLWWNFGKHESRIQWTKDLHRENPTTSGPWTWDHKSLSWVHFKLTHPIKPKIYILSWFFFFLGKLLFELYNFLFKMFHLKFKSF